VAWETIYRASAELPQRFVEFRLEDVIKGGMTGRATEEQIDCATIPACRLVNNVRFLQPESLFATQLTDILTALLHHESSPSWNHDVGKVIRSLNNLSNTTTRHHALLQRIELKTTQQNNFVTP
jgi:hypothetical protein